MRAGARRRRLDACRVLWVTDRFRMRAPLVPHGEALLRAGLPGLVLRERDLDDAPFEDMARRLRAEADRRGALLLVTNRLEVARRAAHGVHLGSRGPSAGEARKTLGEEALIGVSLHAGDDPLAAAWRDADYYFYSPVFASESKPGVSPLGLASLAAFCRTAAKPVFALGGVRAATVAACRDAGAHGVAVVGALAGGEPAAAWAAWQRTIEGGSGALPPV